MQPIPLSEEDRAILALEGPTIVGHTCKVIRLAEPAPSLQALRAHIGSRLGGEPLLRTRLEDRGGAPRWIGDPGFEIANHVVDTGRRDLDEADLEPLVAQLFERRLDRDLPLWRIDVAHFRRGGVALIWRIHHALADGTTAMRFARSILWDKGEGAARGVGPPQPQVPGPPGRVDPAPSPGRQDDDRRRGHLAAFLAREFADSIHDSPFDGEVGRRRTVAFAAVPLGPLHDAAKRICGATVNDAVLSVVAGGLRRWLESHHGSLSAMRFRVPVSLHNEGDQAGNRDSFFTLPVHVSDPDPASRLRAIQAEASERKAGHDAERLSSLSDSIGSLSPRLAGLARRLQDSPRSFAICVSNVPGPPKPVTVLGAPVQSLHSIAEIGGRHGLRVTVVSGAGRLGFGFCADPAIAEDLSEMAAGTEAEAAALIAAG